ncbi:MAG: 4-hydroxy-tetrahydrodipicolinate synthase [Clostridia bacterium]|nr:4-hydroxy-tetrahydrodipicolinate synthase [Clostridia bacterium]
MSEKKTSVFRGAAAALPTFFTKDGAVDEAAYVRLIDRLIGAGIQAIVAAGTTGEAAALTEEEYERVVSLAAESAAGRVPVIAGVAGSCTARAAARSRSAGRAGADALLAVTPYYNKASEEGLLRHYGEIAAASSLPILLYNVPGRTGLDLPLAVTARLAREPQFVGIKEASGNVLKAARTVAACPPDFAVYSGSDEVTLPIMAVGGIGCISVAANVLPELTVEMTERFFRGDAAGAAKIQRELLPVIDALFAEVNPIPVKAALAMQGFGGEFYRLPLCPPSEATRAKIKETLGSTQGAPFEKDAP